MTISEKNSFLCQPIDIRCLEFGVLIETRCVTIPLIIGVDHNNIGGREFICERRRKCLGGEVRNEQDHSKFFKKIKIAFSVNFHFEIP